MTDLFTPPDDNDGDFDPNKNYLETLVGDGKKFKTVEDLAKGKAEADLYIKTILRTQDELRADYERLREEYNSRAKLEELIDQLNTSNLASSNSTPPANEDTNTPNLKPEDIESLVMKKLQETELKRNEERNINTVMAKLKEKFGNNYADVLNRQAEQLGLSKEDVTNLAKKSPNAFLKVMELDKPAEDNTLFKLPRNERRPDTFAPTSTQKRSWSYYEKMRKENPKAYFDPKTQVQMHHDAIALGDAFND